ncbi:MAG: ABC transporter permease [Actinobacteria bacterium]|nr:ABC transporter permease [Actinomycetota bacterium]
MTLRYLLSRLASSGLTLLLLSAVIFVLVRVSGDPVAIMLPSDSPPDVVAAFRSSFGLDRPVLVQYVHYLGNALRGDLGTSLKYSEPVLSLVLERLPATFSLGFAALVISLLFAVPLGILAAVYRGRWVDRIVTVIPLVGQSFPVFWIGIMLALLFSVKLRWLPVSGYGKTQHLILPAFTLGIYFTARLSRLITSSMVESLRKDYIRTARAKGLPPWSVIIKHAFRNSMVSVVTMTGMQLAALLGGAVVTETVFAWPGIGRLVIQAVYNRDYPLIQASVLIMAALVILINLLVDACYVLIDPRIQEA